MGQRVSAVLLGTDQRVEGRFLGSYWWSRALGRCQRASLEVQGREVTVDFDSIEATYGGLSLSERVKYPGFVAEGSTPMYIYLLERTDQPVHDSESRTLVVVAQTPKQARILAQDTPGHLAWDRAKLKNIGMARQGVRQGIIG